MKLLEIDGNTYLVGEDENGVMFYIPATEITTKYSEGISPFEMKLIDAYFEEEE